MKKRLVKKAEKAMKVAKELLTKNFYKALYLGFVDEKISKTLLGKSIRKAYHEKIIWANKNIDGQYVIEEYGWRPSKDESYNISVYDWDVCQNSGNVASCNIRKLMRDGSISIPDTEAGHGLLVILEGMGI